MKQYGKRVDQNQRDIVKLFEQLGCLVYDASPIGGGFPDLIIQRKRPQDGFVETLLVEVKNGALAPSRRRLNELQKVFHSIWTCHVVECENDVYELLGLSPE